MEYLIGIIIATLIALTGVGAGTVTVPLLITFLGVPAPAAVALGLTFSSAVKLILAPVQIASRNVCWKTLMYMLLGGVPGVFVGSLLLQHLVSSDSRSQLNLLLGFVLVTTALWQVALQIYKNRMLGKIRDRSHWMPWLMFPVGAEVGFSSAGAGALGSVALLSFTPLQPTEVIGTDILYGLGLSLVGSGLHLHSLHQEQTLLCHLIVGGIAGGIFGTLLSKHIPRRPLRLIVWICILALGANMIATNIH